MRRTHAYAKRILGIVMTVAMLIGMLPLYAMATDYPNIAPDQEMTVTLDGVLTLNDLTLNVTDEEQYAILGNNDLKIVVNGTVVLSTVGDDGIDAEDNTINGGYITIVTNDEDGFEANGYIEVNGGYIVIDADEFGFNSMDYYVEINGGDIYIESGEGAISAYDSIYVSEDMGTFESAYDEVSNLYYLAAVKAGEINIADGITDNLPEAVEIKRISDTEYLFADGAVAQNAILTDMTYGDANFDGKINLSDVSILLQFIASWDVVINEFAADTNADGKINLSDVSLILQYIAGWDVTLGK